MKDTTGDESVADTAIARDSPASGRWWGWLGIALAIFFGLFYVYDLFGAISNVVGVTSQITLYNEARAVVKLAPVPIPWFWLVVDLVAAPVAYVLAFAIGRRSTLPVRALLFFVGLSLVAAVTLTAEALA